MRDRQEVRSKRSQVRSWDTLDLSGTRTKLEVSGKLELEIKVTGKLPEIPKIHRLEAENRAREAYLMTLLKHADISAGLAAQLLGINRWQLSDLMDLYEISPFPTQTREELECEITQARQFLVKHQ